MEEEIIEVAESPEVSTDVFVDPRIAELEKEVHELQEKNFSLQRDISAANSMIERLRIAKEGYKAVTKQGANEVDYAYKMVPTVYLERRQKEFRKEFHAVQDVN